MVKPLRFSVAGFECRRRRGEERTWGPKKGVQRGDFGGKAKGKEGQRSPTLHFTFSVSQRGWWWTRLASTGSFGQGQPSLCQATPAYPSAPPAASLLYSESWAGALIFVAGSGPGNEDPPDFAQWNVTLCRSVPGSCPPVLDSSSSFQPAKSYFFPKPIGSISPSLRKFFQLFTFPLTFWRMQWFSLAKGLHSSGFLGSPMVGLSVSKCKSVFDPVPAPWGQRLGFFTASLQRFSSTMHQSRVSFYHLPRECSIFPNKVALKNKAHRSIENENWSSLLLSQFFYYWCPLLSLMPLLPEASLYKHKLTPSHRHISLLLLFF